MSRKMIEILMILLVLSVTLTAADEGYSEPDEKLVEIYDIPPLPYLNFSSYENIALEKRYSRDIMLKDLARNEIGLAGEKLHTDINAYWDNYPDTEISFLDLKTNEKVKINLPQDIQIRSTHLSWDRSKIAIISQQNDGIYLGIYDFNRKKYQKISDLTLHDILGTEVQWYNDNRHILVLSIEQNRSAPPEKSPVPQKPIIEETSGITSQTRTYTNLLDDAYSEKLFEYYFTSQPVIIDAEKLKYKKLGEPGIYPWLELSPDNEYIIVSQLHKPWSRELPWYRFPRKYQVWDASGSFVRLLYDRPLQDEVPIGGVYQGPRSFEWVPDKAAEILWVEALDEGDPKNEVEYRDKVMLLQDLKNGTAREILRTEKRFRGFDWTEKENCFIYYDYDRDTFWLRGWLTDLNNDDKIIIEDRNIRDKYNDPGNLLHKRNKFNRSVARLEKDNVWFINKVGASEQGQYPFLKKVNLKTKEEETLFRCREGFWEVPVCFIDKEMQIVAVSSQNQDNPRNYYLYDTESGERKWLTEYKDPYPDWAKLTKEVVYYTRKDSVQLSGTLYLPPGYDGEEKLPLVISAYPEEYTDTSTAGQTGRSADRFTYFSGASIRYFALSGYAVLAGASIPIIGEPETVNETFIDQTVSSVQAAIDYLADRNLIDPKKVGITGHSYGAFMVANVLAHSDLCAAGIAKSGAYNRTLTPFGFQSERRTFWQAGDFYLKVSPFMHADEINEPMLLIHGEEDDNSGTYPMQTRRLYAALKGNGATARMVILPLEHHGYRARESNLHVINEMINWFDRFLKEKD